MLVGPLHLLSGVSTKNWEQNRAGSRCQEKFTPKIHPKILPKENRQRASKQKKHVQSYFYQMITLLSLEQVKCKRCPTDKVF